MKLITAEEAVKNINSGDRVFIQSVAAAPQTLIKAMTARHEKLQNVEIYHLHTEGVAPYAESQYKDSFHGNSFFIGANVRAAVASGEADFIPCFLSEVPILMRGGVIPIDVALIQVSPPDKHGATLQMGIGAIPNAVLAALTNHKDLGIHTEMFADGLIPLLEKGIVNGAKNVFTRKKLLPAS